MLVFMFLLIVKTLFVCIIETTNTKQDILTNWHPTQVKEALEMSGTNLSKLAKEHKYAHINEVLNRPRVAKVAPLTGQASEPSSATSEERSTVKKGSVKTEGPARRAGGA